MRRAPQVSPDHFLPAPCGPTCPARATLTHTWHWPKRWVRSFWCPGKSGLVHELEPDGVPRTRTPTTWPSGRGARHLYPQTHLPSLKPRSDLQANHLVPFASLLSTDHTEPVQCHRGRGGSPPRPLHPRGWYRKVQSSVGRFNRGQGPAGKAAQSSPDPT